MSQRHGVTAQEEHKLKVLVSQGKSWDQIVEMCQPNPDKLTPALLQDVNLDHVKKSIFEPLARRYEEAKKSGHKSIIDHERHLAKKRADEKKATKDEE
jgi:hypothetical protein